MTRVNACLLGEREQASHDRVHLVCEAGRATASGSADRTFEEAVSSETVLFVDEECGVIGAMAGCRNRADLKLTRSNGGAVFDRLVNWDAGLPGQPATD